MDRELLHRGKRAVGASARLERRRGLARERQRRRRANPAVCAKEVAAKCHRREANPELRRKEAETRRRRMQVDFCGQTDQVRKASESLVNTQRGKPPVQSTLPKETCIQTSDLSVQGMWGPFLDTRYAGHPPAA